MEQLFEKLGVFYLGREHDLASDKTGTEYVLYDAKDMTTHGVCVGMTGSGKTGLCISLLEEAGIDGIPAIVVDPKGDIGNLLLTFPQLQAEDFRPWIDESEAARKQLSPDAFAQQTAQQWRQGLADWQQDGARIGRFREAVDLAIYTPGGSAGLPLTVLRSFAAPAAELRDDTEAFRDRVAAATAGLLALLGLDIDPVRSREFILVASLLDQAWRSGRDMDLAGLIRAIQNPPLERIGVLDLDTFYPAKDRQQLAMTLNSLLASPSFAGWLEGEPLDIKRLLYTPAGKPRISILSIAHLSDAERMFFVTILLNELLAWVRTQPGTTSLRALFYMDEVFGYFPPVANPPSKTPMLTLLKQARAFGLGLLLATQNPVDLDYKGLSNCGTWFLGRLQTERDKMRVLDGLESASSQGGFRVDRQQLDAALSGLRGRVFLMNNVHEQRPVAFHTRWALSYLRGPLTRDQIRVLMEERQGAAAAEAVTSAPAESSVAVPAATSLDTSIGPAVSAGDVPAGIPQRYVSLPLPVPDGARVVYQPALLGMAQLHFVRASSHVDHWQQHGLLCHGASISAGKVWDAAEPVHAPPLAETAPSPHAECAPLPPALTVARNFDQWQRGLKETLYRTQTLTIFRCPALKEHSRPDESETDFRIRLAHRLHELRDEKVTALREKYAAQVHSLQERIARAQQQLQESETEQQQDTLDSAISLGQSIFGALFSRKKLSRTNVDRVSSSARKMRRIARSKEDVQRARAALDRLLEQRAELDERIARDVLRLEAAHQSAELHLETISIRPRKSDITVQEMSVIWLPHIAQDAP